MLNIAGFMPTTLLDYPQKLACTIFLPGCNLRCPFCQNASLVLRNTKGETLCKGAPPNGHVQNAATEKSQEEVLMHSGRKPPQEKNAWELLQEDMQKHYTEEEILAFLQKRKHVLEGVCISGGEPTLHSGLPEFLCKIKNLGYLVKLDTNGTRPDVIRRLVEDGLIDYVAMDVKSSEAGYAKAAGISGLAVEPIKESIAFLASCGIPHEFRTTLVKGIHTQEDVKALASLVPRDSNYFLQSYEDSPLVLSKVLQDASSDSLHSPEDSPLISSKVLQGTSSEALHSSEDSPLVLSKVLQGVSSDSLHSSENTPTIPSVLPVTGEEASSFVTDAAPACASFGREELKHFIQLLKPQIPNVSLRGIE